MEVTNDHDRAGREARENAYAPHYKKGYSWYTNAAIELRSSDNYLNVAILLRTQGHETRVVGPAFGSDGQEIPYLVAVLARKRS